MTQIMFTRRHRSLQQRLDLKNKPQSVQDESLLQNILLMLTHPEFCSDSDKTSPLAHSQKDVETPCTLIR